MAKETQEVTYNWSYNTEENLIVMKAKGHDTISFPYDIVQEAKKQGRRHENDSGVTVFVTLEDGQEFRLYRSNAKHPETGRFVRMASPNTDNDVEL